MSDILIIDQAWDNNFKDIAGKYTILKYTNDSFGDIIKEVMSSSEDYASLTVITDYHPELPDFLDKSPQKDNNYLIKVEPVPFTHPFCHFSGPFFFSILWLLNNYAIFSMYSYMISIPRKILLNQEISGILKDVRTPGAFGVGMFALSVKKKIPVRKHTLPPYRNPHTLYEVLKNEFIHTTAVLMKLLEIRSGDKDTTKISFPFFDNPDDKIRVPGHTFLLREFITGFRKYAPFWKEHLSEDHFALLSEIYSGKEDLTIDDRTWIRIMLELINVSFRFDDKAKIARRIFPVYALYLKSIHKTSIRERLSNYSEILKEESKFLSIF